MRSYAAVISANTASSSQSMATSTVIDINHPYYISNSDHPGLSLVSDVLTAHNYHQ